MDHKPVLIAALAFIALLGAMTMQVLITTGPDVLSLTSIVVLTMLGIAVYGAIKEPPDP